MEFHIFADASKQAYGTVAYLVTPKGEEEGDSQFLMSKAKITPIKQTDNEDTIPKLEMMGIVLAANLASFCLEALKDYKFKKKIIWSDSRVALAQCSAKKSHKSSFVHNRIVRIRELCQGFDIRYVDSKDNPADLVTKPISAKNLKENELWKKGPDWLTDIRKWKEEEQKYDLFPITTELEDDWKIVNNLGIQVRITNMLGAVKAEIKEEQYSKYWRSSYEKTIRFFAMIIKWQKKSKKLDSNGRDFTEGERFAVKLMQKESFKEELKNLKEGKRIRNNSLAQMKLYLDEYGIIRCQGRLNDTGFVTINTPILFAYNHPLTILYIQ